MFMLRGIIYILAIAGMAQLISLEGYQQMFFAKYGEHSVTEHLQDILTFSSSVLFLYISRINPKLKIATIFSSALMAMMFVRESDALLDHYVFDGAWQSIVSLILVVIAVYAWKRLPFILDSFQYFSKRPSYGTFLAGVVTVLVFSRLMGRDTFWHAVMGESYLRVVKNIVEEGTETLGYSLIFMSAIELMLFALNKRKLQGKKNRYLSVEKSPASGA